MFSPHTGKLAHVHDEQGREAISLCHASVRAEFERRIYFYGRYELQEGPAIHCSATALVIFTDDHGAVGEYERIFKNAAGEGYLNQSAFKSAAAIAGVAVDDDATLFQRADTDDNKTISRDEFVRFCCRVLHGSASDKTRRVVIKFMSDKEQFERERSFRMDQ